MEHTSHSLVLQAMLFAHRVHGDHKRRYTGEPYVKHLAEVVGIVAAVDTSEEALAVAWLHDCIEDMGVTKLRIAESFGVAVAEGVDLLSDREVGNRRVRKEAAAARLAQAPSWVQNIKVADVFSNVHGILTQPDKKFAGIWAQEKLTLLNGLTRAHPTLVGMCRAEFSVYYSWSKL